jgi:hypothetical protein
VAHKIALPGDTGYLDLPDTADGYISAVICRRPDGSGWQALPPEGDQDAWVTVSLEDDSTVVANSWSGWRGHLDPATGTETARHFTE